MAKIKSKIKTTHIILLAKTEKKEPEALIT